VLDAGQGCVCVTKTAYWHFRELDGAQAWRTLMGPDFLEHEEATGAIADYIIAAWNTRRAVLNGREANGGDPTA
jgi:hypothetical protein